MKRNGFEKRYQAVYNFDFSDRTYFGDSKEEKEKKDLRRKARYVTVIDGKVYAGGECYGLEGKALNTAMVYRLRNYKGAVNNELNHDPCEKYREEYVKKYGGTMEDLE